MTNGEVRGLHGVGPAVVSRLRCGIAARAAPAGKSLLPSACKAAVRRMVPAAAVRGYRYVATTDHSPSTPVVAGLDAGRVRDQATEITRVQEDHPDIRIMHGCEAGILRDGTLDLDDEVLPEQDSVLVAVHSGFDMAATSLTGRIIRAMENPPVHVLCHPTGRKPGRRGSYPVDLPAIPGAARDPDVAREVNGSARRLDRRRC